MNRILKQLMPVFIAVVAAACLNACGNDDGLDTSSATELSDDVVVSFSLGGEISSATSPMTRAGITVEGLYAVQVDDADGNRYAYGLYDLEHINDMQVTLKRNKTYSFRASAIIDGEDVIYKDDDGIYGAPLRIGLTNDMVYSTTEGITGISDGTATVISNDIGVSYDQPAIDRYYGETTVNVSSNSNLSIDMYRMVYELEVEITNDSFDGTVSVSSLHGHIPGISLTEGQPMDDRIYSLTDLATAYSQKDATEAYFEEDTFVFTWTRGDGTEVTLAGGESVAVRKYRNMKTTISVTLDTSVRSGLVLNITDEEIGDGPVYNVDSY